MQTKEKLKSKPRDTFKTTQPNKAPSIVTRHPKVNPDSELHNFLKSLGDEFVEKYFKIMKDNDFDNLTDILHEQMRERLQEIVENKEDFEIIIRRAQAAQKLSN